jgi:O-acetyl-ADP-ribose deacetylase (regulator of RNase III)
MVTLFVGDIAKVEGVDAVACATNGWADFNRGAIAALMEKVGSEIVDEAKGISRKKSEPLEEGTVFRTNSGKLKRKNIKFIYHAVICSYPNSLTSIHTVGRVMKQILRLAIRDGVKKIAVTGMGTGDGSLEKSSVASKMVQIAEDYGHLIDVVFWDIDDKFIEEVRHRVKTG